jgi:hypothetical protein
MRPIRLAGIALLTSIASLAALAAPSQARDRNHDRISDRWERSHHLSLRVNQARRDQDHDGLKNRGEFRAQDDPRDADSDNDGVEDGDERAGTITNVTGDTITVTLFGGGTITGKVTAQTEVECDTGGDGDGDGSGDDEEGDDGHGERSLRHEGSNGEGENGDHESDNEACPAGALKLGAIVQEAEVKLSNGIAVFKEIELVS